MLNTHAVTSTGFPAIAGIGVYSNGTNPTVLSSLPAAVLSSQGVSEYYSLVLPRGVQFNTTDDIISADPDVTLWTINDADVSDLPIAITTQHKATLDLLADLYPNAEVLVQRNADGSPRNLTPDEVTGKHIIGVLPPFLVAAASAFTSVSIDGYNAAVDGDLSADELRDRIRIADKAITVEEVQA
ncbi:hypothetical protein ABHN03_16945 [Paenibacillus sp. NRS-1775]|uniref:CRISPR-associated protein Csx16 n=1 Tax=unclassified Paenibacillus TaxID=185978 RepID=UPI003D2886E4